MTRFIFLLSIIYFFSSCDNKKEEAPGYLLGLVYDDHYSSSNFEDKNPLRYEFYAFEFDDLTEISTTFNSRKKDFFVSRASSFSMSDTLEVPFDILSDIDILFEYKGLKSFFSEQALQKFDGSFSFESNEVDSLLSLTWPIIDGINYTHITLRKSSSTDYTDTLLLSGNSITLDLRRFAETQIIGFVITVIKGPLPGGFVSNIEGDIEAQVLIGSRFTLWLGNPIYSPQGKEIAPNNTELNRAANALLLNRFQESN